MSTSRRAPPPPSLLLHEEPDHESRVLVIYTGGTIGMLVGAQGYQPEPFYLTSTLMSQARFHDPFGDSLFSNSGSVQGFRDWSTAGGHLAPTSAASGPRNVKQQTLTVRSSCLIAIPPALAGALGSSGTEIGEDGIYEMEVPSLITPKNHSPHGSSKRIRYAVLEWQQLLDSSDMDISDWVRIATEIELNYSNFDAFVILHGSDTMCYTSSALSFLFEDLGKTVILTGAQIPLSELRNDAVDNLLGALTIAGNYIIPECSLYFNHTLFRGNRVSKTSSFDFDAFSSPNFPALVNVGTDMVVNWSEVLRPRSVKRFRAHKEMCPNVATLRLFPGITAATVRAFLAPPIQGAVLESFGAGNAPQRKDLMNALKEACDRGVVIVNISQCAKGSVTDAYAAGRALMNAGVVPGADMTPECALTKLAYLLSKAELSNQEIRERLCTPLRGELTLPVGIHKSSTSSSTTAGSVDIVHDLIAQVMRISFPKATKAIVAPKLDRRALGFTDITSSKSEADFSSDTTASWPLTASEALTTEAALLPLLMHLAVSRDDFEGAQFCMTQEDAIASAVGSVTPISEVPRAIASGVVNCRDSGSGRSPLHVAALNGSEKCASLLLTSGASVHLRDSLDHTALYYAARRGHGHVVELLVEAGANLGGSDLGGGFAQLEVEKAQASANAHALQIWARVGLRPRDA